MFSSGLIKTDISGIAKRRAVSPGRGPTKISPYRVLTLLTHHSTFGQKNNLQPAPPRAIDLDGNRIYWLGGLSPGSCLCLPTLKCQQGNGGPCASCWSKIPNRMPSCWSTLWNEATSNLLG